MRVSLGCLTIVLVPFFLGLGWHMGQLVANLAYMKFFLGMW